MDIVGSLFQNDNYQATKKMLDAAALRHQAIASNIANVTTPGYKRVDLNKSFEAELASHLQSGQGEAIQAVQPSLEEDETAISFRVDGNNVQIDKELMAMAVNSTNYQALTQFVSSSIRHLRTAIVGRNLS